MVTIRAVTLVMKRATGVDIGNENGNEGASKMMMEVSADLFRASSERKQTKSNEQRARSTEHEQRLSEQGVMSDERRATIAVR